MKNNLFIGGLAYEVTDAQLEEHFKKAGSVLSAKVIIDRATGQGKGLGFVEMATEEDAQKAVKTLNGYILDGRAIVVNEARPREDRPSYGSGGGNRGPRNDYSRSNKRW